MKFLSLPTDTPGLSEYLTVAGTAQSISKTVTFAANTLALAGGGVGIAAFSYATSANSSTFIVPASGISSTVMIATSGGTSTTTTHAAFATVTAGVYTTRALAAGDLPAATTSAKGAVVLATDGEVAASEVVESTDNRLLAAMDSAGRIFGNGYGIRTAGTTFLTADTAYFIYLGRVAKAMTPKYVKGHLVGLSTGAQTMEIGLFSSASGPDGGSKTLTKIVSTGTCDDTTAGANLQKGNTSAFATSVAAGTHLWAGIRSNCASSQPGYRRFEEGGKGTALTLASSGALTAAGPFVAAVPSTTTLVPDLFAFLD